MITQYAVPRTKEEIVVQANYSKKDISIFSFLQESIDDLKKSKVDTSWVAIWKCKKLHNS